MNILSELSPVFSLFLYDELNQKYMVRKSLLFSMAFLGVLLLGISPAAVGQENGIKWMSMEEAEALSRQHPKKIFVDVYTDWCSWCRRMSSETYTHPVIIEYVNKHFYAVKLNAEQVDPITFRGTEYVNQNAGQRRSAHDFAIALLQGRMSYPSVAFFDEELRLITALPGYRPPAKMEPVLVFFNDEVFKDNADLDGFVNNFDGSIK
jgi:thioredoxin-related protein